MAEQISWRKPGSVSSSVRAPPPMVSFASRTMTENPSRARRMAAASPFGPEPTMTRRNEIEASEHLTGGRLRGSKAQRLREAVANDAL